MDVPPLTARSSRSKRFRAVQERILRAGRATRRSATLHPRPAFSCDDISGHPGGQPQRRVVNSSAQASGQSCPDAGRRVQPGQDSLRIGRNRLRLRRCSGRRVSGHTEVDKVGRCEIRRVVAEQQAVETRRSVQRGSNSVRRNQIALQRVTRASLMCLIAHQNHALFSF